jgi:hypothetical protein
MRILRRAAAAALACALIACSAEAASAQGTALPKTFGAAKGDALALLAANCSSCHAWAGAYETILDPAVVVAGKPEASPAWLAVSEGRMPPDGPLPDADKAAILAWIQAGAPAPAAGRSAAPRASAGFLGFDSKESFHRFSGWASGGLLLAAGVVGAAHAYGMMSTAHDWRDANYPYLDEFSPLYCPPEVARVYGDPAQQALRWTHVGLLAAGESFYLANALTGTSFMGRLGPGWSKAKIHRYAFFVHAGLMASEAVMGYFSSGALSRGEHETFRALLTAHAAVGIAIPVVILGAGAIMDPGIKL